MYKRCMRIPRGYIYIYIQKTMTIGNIETSVDGGMVSNFHSAVYFIGQEERTRAFEDRPAKASLRIYIYMYKIRAAVIVRMARSGSYVEASVSIKKVTGKINFAREIFPSDVG